MLDSKYRLVSITCRVPVTAKNMCHGQNLSSLLSGGWSSSRFYIWFPMMGWHAYRTPYIYIQYIYMIFWPWHRSEPINTIFGGGNWHSLVHNKLETWLLLLELASIGVRECKHCPQAFFPQSSSTLSSWSILNIPRIGFLFTSQPDNYSGNFLGMGDVKHNVPGLWHIPIFG